MRILLWTLLVLFATSSNAGTPLEEYEKARKGGYADKYKESSEKAGGKTKEEFNKIDKAQPGQTYQDSDKKKYIKRCGYGNSNCTWEPAN